MIDYEAHRFPDLTELTVHVGLGGNQGDRLDYLRRALFAMLMHPEIRVTAVSRVYETEYVGPGEQPPYLNACLEARTWLAPRVLLCVLQGIEQRLGRRPDSHWRPRPIDLDILLCGELIERQPQLTVPHPRAHERGFVLEPLRDIAPERVFPDSGETVAATCERIRRQKIHRVTVREDCVLLPGGEATSEEDWRAALAVHCR